MVVIRRARHDEMRLLDWIEDESDQLLLDWLNLERWGSKPTGIRRDIEHGFILVAQDESGAVVGFAHVIEHDGIEHDGIEHDGIAHDGIAHLEQVSVLPSYGRRGYGRQLVEAAKSEARRRGHHRLTLRTFAEVPWNAPFYASAGFVVQEPVTDFHRALAAAEAQLGLDTYGPRVHMVADLQEVREHRA